jgi:hypothetical protein
MIFLFAILIITIIIEFLIYLLFIKKQYKKLLIYSILINSFTNPLANLFFSLNYNIFIIELFVFLIEVVLIKYLFNLRLKKSIIISFLANLISFLIGIILSFIIF